MASSGSTPAVPVVIGVGDFKNPSKQVADALEPAELMLRAIKIAIEDSGLSVDSQEKLQSSIDSIDVVRCWTWPYPDLPGLLSQNLGVDAKHKKYSDHGGNQSGKLFDQAARRISQGNHNVAVVTGGEALASLTACANERKMPPPGWSQPAHEITSVFSPTNRDPGANLGGIHSIGAPIQVYPLYENAFRAHRGQNIEDNSKESATMYANFSAVSKKNCNSWNYGKAETAESIGTVSKKNRMICFPYPLLMNTFNTVNIAAACVITSTAFAEKIGVPKEKWIYPLGGAGTADARAFWERPNYYSSPAISRSLDAAFKVSGITKDDVDFYDFYSCFPIVPKLACNHLGLSITMPSKPITLLGGMTSFGGAGNNYSMHALTESVRQLRAGNGSCGVVLANGGVVSYEHVVCLSSRPRKGNSAYPATNPLPDLITDVPTPQVELEPEGEAVIETYTVDFDRDGMPSQGHIVGRLKSNGNRFLANHADAQTLHQLVSKSDEPVGRIGWVTRDRGQERRNLFRLESRTSLTKL